MAFCKTKDSPRPTKITASYQGTVTTSPFPSIVLLYSSCKALIIV